MTKVGTQNGISEATGRARLAGGTTTVLYRALRPLICTACARPIEPETLFTRHALHGSTLLIMPQCPECAPFEIERESRARSALVRSLLDVQTPPRDGKASTQGVISSKTKREEDEVAEKIRYEVERRLGPALRRSRRAAR